MNTVERVKERGRCYTHLETQQKTNRLKNTPGVIYTAQLTNNETFINVRDGYYAKFCCLKEMIITVLIV